METIIYLLIKVLLGLCSGKPEPTGVNPLFAPEHNPKRTFFISPKLTIQQQLDLSLTYGFNAVKWDW